MRRKTHSAARALRKLAKRADAAKVPETHLSYILGMVEGVCMLDVDYIESGTSAFVREAADVLAKWSATASEIAALTDDRLVRTCVAAWIDSVTGSVTTYEFKGHGVSIEVP